MFPSSGLEEPYTPLTPLPSFPSSELGPGSTDPLENRSSSDIQFLLDDLERKNEHLQEEIYIIRSYLKNSPRAETFDSQREIPPGFILREMPQRRLEVVQRQEEALNAIRVSTEQQHENDVDELRAATKEAEIEHDLVVADEDDFRRFRAYSINQRSGRVMAERVEQYLTRQLQDQENERLKLLQRKKKMTRALRKRTRQLRMNAHETEKHNRVDFDQLKIENQQMRLREEHLNRQIVRVKSRTGRTQHLLTSLMDKLSTYQSNQRKLESLISDRSDRLQDLAVRIQKEERLKEYHERRNKQLRRHHRELRVPEVPKYVKVKSDLHTVRREVMNWKRKLSIARMNENLYGNKVQLILRQVKQLGVVLNGSMFGTGRRRRRRRRGFDEEEEGDGEYYGEDDDDDSLQRTGEPRLLMRDVDDRQVFEGDEMDEGEEYPTQRWGSGDETEDEGEDD